ncbi:MAG TPA: phosphoribosylglycinamide formyltransferase [Vicinamibacteria bacterium]
MKNLGVLVSGRGSNLQALLDAASESAYPGRVAVVVSNVESAQALERARRAGVPAHFRDHRGRPREDFDRELLALLRDHQVDLVCLAGFMRRLSPVFLGAFQERVLNVHPSLLPAFPGLEAQRQALEYGAKVSGATVHLVDEGLDRGPVILQQAVPILEGDSVASLSARILEVEHQLYPQAVRILLEGRYRRDGRRFILEGA